MGGLTPENTAAQQQAYGECRRVAPLMLGDFYPLTPYSRDLEHWIAWQFNRPEEGDGVIQAFRRANCEEAEVTYRLSGLEPDALYRVTDLDVPDSTEMRGADLMTEGLRIETSGKPAAVIVLYKKVR